MKTRALPNQPNKSTFSDFILFTDDDGNALDLSTVDEISVRIRDPLSDITRLEATLSGATIIETGTDGEVQFTFTAEQMGGLCPQNYEFGVLVTIAGVTTQTHLCPLSIIEGL